MDVHIPKLDSSMGSVLIGVIVSAMLSGVTYVQSAYYFINYSEDRRLLKLLVAGVVIFDTAHQVLVSHAVYDYVITNYNNPSQLSVVVWSGTLEYLFSVLVVFMVQCFYLMRIWQLSKSYLLTGFIFVIIVACAACGLAWVILSMITPTFQELWLIVPISIAIYALASGADIIIAASLIIILRSHRAHMVTGRSDSMINKLILQTVNTGALTSVMAVALLIAITVSPRTLIYVAFDFCIVRFYTNSFLATLNMRKHVSRMPMHDFNRTTTTIPIPLFSQSPASSSTDGSTLPCSSSILVGVCTAQEWHEQKLLSSQDQDSKGYVDVEIGKPSDLAIYVPHPAGGDS